ncbi:anti-sigma factor family protein [Caldalkalibacillus salinus]|uniref:anti-sigma factor family protein n=1 Tax=Caldalkalibacillus salinus TaxID=2803787 RepID=UPI0019233072|nr:zf-HC2 domain-containing protein [Caldalkalibacillus salinus]
MNCDKALEWIQRQLDHDLNPNETEELQQHLSHCTTCQEQYDKLTTVSGELETLPDVSPPINIVDSILPHLGIQQDQLDQSHNEESTSGTASIGSHDQVGIGFEDEETPQNNAVEQAGTKRGAVIQFLRHKRTWVTGTAVAAAALLIMVTYQPVGVNDMVSESMDSGSEDAPVSFSQESSESSKANVQEEGEHLPPADSQGDADLAMMQEGNASYDGNNNVHHGEAQQEENLEETEPTDEPPVQDQDADQSDNEAHEFGIASNDEDHSTRDELHTFTEQPNEYHSVEEDTYQDGDEEQTKEQEKEQQQKLDNESQDVKKADEEEQVVLSPNQDFVAYEGIDDIRIDKDDHPHYIVKRNWESPWELERLEWVASTRLYFELYNSESQEREYWLIHVDEMKEVQLDAPYQPKEDQ